MAYRAWVCLAWCPAGRMQLLLRNHSELGVGEEEWCVCDGPMMELVSEESLGGREGGREGAKLGLTGKVCWKVWSVSDVPVSCTSDTCRSLSTTPVYTQNKRDDHSQGASLSQQYRKSHPSRLNTAVHPVPAVCSSAGAALLCADGSLVAPLGSYSVYETLPLRGFSPCELQSSALPHVVSVLPHLLQHPHPSTLPAVTGVLLWRNTKHLLNRQQTHTSE
jgi:hypothetical protein